MSLAPRSEQLRQAVRQMAGECPASDTDLLTRYAAARDEAAFAALVSRHGRLVYGVCRRVLADRHRAEDAYQAVWLVLTRRAAEVRPASRLPAWLHGVAYRTALKLKTADARRRRREQVVTPMEPTPPPDAELQAVIDAELAALPDRLRLPVLLCDLDGQPQREAARRLGLPTSTLANRLQAARDRLAARLTARGLAPAVAVGVWEAVPPVRATEPAVRLAEQVLTGLTLAKWKGYAVAAAVIAGGLILLGQAAGVSPLLPQPPDNKPIPQGADTPRPAAEPFLDRLIRDLRGDTPTVIERNYYRADPDPLRDWNAAVFACYDDPTVRGRLDTKPGWPLSGFFMGEKDQPPAVTDRVRLVVVRVKAGVEPGRAKPDEIDSSQVFEWPVPPPRPPQPKHEQLPYRSLGRDAVPARHHLAAFDIDDPDELSIVVRRADDRGAERPLPDEPINGKHTVMNGMVSFGRWGTVRVKGLTLDQAVEAVRQQVAKTPAADGTRIPADRLRAWVDLTAVYRTIRVATDVPHSQPGEWAYTGSNTVVDAVDAAVSGCMSRSDLRVWVQRRRPGGQPDQILPVDWHAVRAGQAKMNYVLRAGDEVHVMRLHPDRERELAEAEQAAADARRANADPKPFDARVAAARLAATRPPSEEDDDVFLRRLLLAVRGTPPTGLERDYFRRDDDPDKRAKVAGWLRPKSPAHRATARDRYTLLPPDSLLVYVKRIEGKPEPSPGLTTAASVQLTPDGTLAGLPGFNSVAVSGLTVPQAADAIRKAVKNPADADRITVEVRIDGYNNHRGFELIEDGPDGKPVVRKIAYRGETVFKQLMRDADGPADYDGKRIWIERGGRRLPVDWDAITRRRDEATNHVIEPGDRVYVSGWK